jgi:hypothetical protein
VVRHDNLNDVRRHGAETVCRVPDLKGVQPAAAEGERSRTVQTERRDFGIDEHRLEIVGDESSISGQGTQKASGDVVERNIVISGDQPGWQGLKKVAPPRTDGRARAE